MNRIIFAGEIFAGDGGVFSIRTGIAYIARRLEDFMRIPCSIIEGGGHGMNAESGFIPIAIFTIQRNTKDLSDIITCRSAQNRISAGIRRHFNRFIKTQIACACCFHIKALSCRNDVLCARTMRANACRVGGGHTQVGIPNVNRIVYFRIIGSQGIGFTPGDWRRVGISN